MVSREGAGVWRRGVSRCRVAGREEICRGGYVYSMQVPVYIFYQGKILITSDENNSASKLGSLVSV